MGKTSNGIRDKRLMCNVISLAYDFLSHTGQLHMREGDCCHMPGCVKIFEGIDPKVTAIDTFSGGKPDTIYRKEDTEWKALSR